MEGLVLERYSWLVSGISSGSPGLEVERKLSHFLPATSPARVNASPRGRSEGEAALHSERGCSGRFRNWKGSPWKQVK